MRALIAFLTGLVIFVACGAFQPAYADDPLPNQPRPDQFPGLAGLSPAEKELLGPNSILRWNYVDNPSCGAYGSIFLDFVEALDEISRVTGAWVVYDPAAYVQGYGNCGTDFTARAGSPAVIGCLCRGFPYNVTIDFNLAMAAYPKETRVSIILHEILHAILVWNEQYNPDFSPTPNWVDFMNTGVNSRHRFLQVELDRWARTAGPERLNGVWMGTHGDGTPFIWWCGSGKRTLWVSLMAYNTVTGEYRWGGVHVPFNSGCTGALATYLQPNEIPCVNPENYVSIRVGRKDICV